MIVLQTQRLTLRTMTPDDLDFLAGMLADPEVMRFYPKCYSRDEAREWLQRQLDRYALYGHGLWLVLDRATGEPLGQCGLAIQEVDGAEEPEIGYMIHRPFWRRGIASEAALAVRDHALFTLDKPYVISLVRPVNVPSQGVARKMGMTPERLTWFKGYEHHVFKVLREAVTPPPREPAASPLQ